jgi:hypothetical protein
MLQSKRNISSVWWMVFKLLLTTAALWFVYEKISNHSDSGDYLNQLYIALHKPGTMFSFIVVFVMMLMNWFVEAIKWKLMIDKIETVTIGRSVEAVFSGITFSFFTPNRIGEYAGRVFHLRAGKRLQATMVTIIENISQLIVTMIAGCIASIFYLKDYLVIHDWLFYTARFLLVIFAVFCVIFFLNIDVFGRLFERFRKSDRVAKILNVFSMYSTVELTKVLLLSLLRYIIFSTQYFLLLKIYGCSFGVSSALVMIAMTFFVMTVIPTFAFAELGIRGAVSAYFFGKLTIDVLPVLNATFSLWLINLAIPAIAGALFIFNFRLEKRRT